MWVRELHPPIAAPLRDMTTERLSLRRIVHDDVDEFAEIFAETDVRAFVLRQEKLWDDFGFGGCAATELASGQLVGVVGLSVPVDLIELLPVVTVGWQLAPEAWGNGYATEGARALLDQAFTTMQLDRVCCVTQSENVRSTRVAERLGMRLARTVLVPPDEQTGAVTAVVYEITAQEWAIRAS